LKATNNGLELEHVGNIVDEGERLARMQETDRRHIPCREHGGLSQP
jgi:hypothetical protein